MLEHDSIMSSPFRHEADVKDSMLNSSASTLLDTGSSARPIATSFSAQSAATTPVFRHGVRGLHNSSYNMQSVPDDLSTRNPGLGGGPSSGAHPAVGRLPAGRFGSNNLPVALLQRMGSITYGVGGSGPGAAPAAGSVGNRGSIGGLGVSPSQIGGARGGLRSSGSIGVGAGGSLSGGGGLNRSLQNSGGGLNVPSLNGSRVNMGSLSNSGGIGMQGPSRHVNSMPQQGVNLSPSTYSPSGDLLAMISRGAPQRVSLLGSNFSSSPGSGNGQLGSLVSQTDGGPNDGVPFDMSDFPHLSTRQTAGGGLRGPVAALRKQGVAVNTIVQQNQEFSIQDEDFPALPGFKGGSTDMTSEMHHKEQQHEIALASIQSQQHSAGADHNFHGAVSDNFPSSHGMSASYHSQAAGPPDTGGSQRLRAGGPPGVTSNLGSYDQMVHPYQQQQSQFSPQLGTHQQQLTAVGQSSRDQGVNSLQGVQATPDRFGILGLLSVMRTTDPDLATLALGTDLTTLGLNLNSRENLYKTFASPWADAPIRGQPEFTLPQCYLQQTPRLQPGYFAQFRQETLFYIFYSMPNDEAQLYAADELANRGWFYHKEHRVWFTRDPNVGPLVKTNTYERGPYYYFDQSTWKTGREENFILHYEMVEKRPQLPSQH